MSNRKKPAVAATSDLDPATLANLEVLKRSRKRIARALLKRRQRKSGQ